MKWIAYEKDALDSVVRCAGELGEGVHDRGSALRIALEDDAAIGIALQVLVDTADYL